MRGKAGPWLVDKFINDIYVQPGYAALHIAAVDPDDPLATEVQGAGYNRKRVLWTKLGTAIANSVPIIWSGMNTSTIRAVSVYTTATGSSLILYVPLATAVTVKAGQLYGIPANELYVDLL